MGTVRQKGRQKGFTHQKMAKTFRRRAGISYEYIPQYKLAQPNKKYRKNPDTFLNGKSWNDELIFDSESNGTTTKQKRTPTISNQILIDAHIEKMRQE